MASSPDVTPSADNTPGSPGSGTTERRGRVRGRRAAVLAVPATLAAATLAVLTAEGILGVQFAISGMPFVVKADKLEGVGFEQYGALDHMIENSPNQGDTDGSVLVVTSVIGKGKLTNMCQAVDLGGIQLLLTAGNKGTKVEVENLAIDSDEIMGNAEFNDIEIGRDSSTFDRVPGFRGPAGVYGQQARTVTINNLYQHNYGATAAVFKLPDLRMKFSTSGCPGT